MLITDLPVADSESASAWLNRYLNSNKIGKSEIASLSVSLQLMISELLEALELISTQITAVSLPSVREKLAKLETQLETVKSEAASSSTQMPDVDKLSQLFAKISQLVRARSNIDNVKERLVVIRD